MVLHLIRRHGHHIYITIRALALITVLIGLMDKSLTVVGWLQSGWNFISYNRWLPILGLVGASIYAYYIYARYGHPRQNLVIWIPVITWFVLEIILLYGIWVGI